MNVPVKKDINIFIDRDFAYWVRDRPLPIQYLLKKLGFLIYSNVEDIKSNFGEGYVDIEGMRSNSFSRDSYEELTLSLRGERTRAGYNIYIYYRKIYQDFLAPIELQKSVMELIKEGEKNESRLTGRMTLEVFGCVSESVRL